ncbi:MAG: TlpA family protein disulfide reductase [Gammaproteobacteria bacterium]|nr:TlpA family protein disulfide reductase [Gammaproteobacteria bacterium]MCI0591440.1 TlpA family protein disulfide reductase [Gammaproteobacteria bacterium]
MKTLLPVLASAALMLLSGLAGYLVHERLTGVPNPAPAALPSTTYSTHAAIGTRRPDFTLPDLKGTARNVGEWDGKVLAVNFWATWCPPCQEEIPEFIELQKEYGPRGLQFVGIAIDDLDSVRDFAQKMEVNYPILIGEQDAIQVATTFGNTIGALPYIAIVDRTGRIVFARRGALSRDEAIKVITALL